MGKVKKWYRSIPVWFTLFLTVAIALAVAGIGTHFTVKVSGGKADEIQSRYVTATYTGTADGVQYSYDFDFHYEDYTDHDMRLYHITRFIETYAAFFWYSVCIILAGLFFYVTKMKRPLNILHKASERISENELDFSVEYPGTDEMAQLCRSFEEMRCALEENNKRMLRMIDERKQLNDAYTHDLRTPIAVLKGYTDMLAKYLPTGKLSEGEIIDTVHTMSSHVERLEQFVDSMNAVQKLEDIEIKKEIVPTDEFLSHLRETADFLCQSSNLIFKFESSATSDTLFLDTAVVTQVYENLLSNAIRFAKSTAIIQCGTDGNTFFVSVTDDGKGFSDKDLLKASRPYYSGQAEKSEFHFGLGLHICRTLCEKHGGTLRLENVPQLGARVTANFSMGTKN